MRNDRIQNGAGAVREATTDEKLAVAGGAGAFLRGSVVQTVGANALATSGGQTAAFPLSISNARFTQSGTTLCNWESCTVYISGC